MSSNDSRQTRLYQYRRT